MKLDEPLVLDVLGLDWVVLRDEAGCGELLQLAKTELRATAVAATATFRIAALLSF